MRFDWSTKLVCFHSAMKHANDVSNVVTVYQLREFTVRALYIIFLFVSNENNNFIN